MVNTSDEFDLWFSSVEDEVRRRLAPKIDRLVLHGPQLGFPESSSITQSRHGGMRELRVQIQGRPYRILYAFDPAREALLILAGDKGGNEAWYKTHIPLADAIFDRHLALWRHDKTPKSSPEKGQKPKKGKS